MNSHVFGRRARSLSLLLATTAIALSSVPFCASAADPAPVASAAEAPPESIIVSASRGTKLEDMDVSTTVMTHDDVVHAPEETLDQILNKIPGVVTPMVPSNEIHPTGKMIQMRGFGGSDERVLVMVDGIPINDPYYRYVNWDKVPKDSVERIEVIRGGGATTLWGNMAMGGVINIVTRDPKANEAHASAGYGSDNTVRSSAGATLYSTSNFKVAADVGRASTDGYNLTPSQYRDAHTVATSSYSDNAELAAYLTPDSSSRYYVKAAVHDMREFGLVWDDTKNTQNSYEFRTGGKTDLKDGSNLDINGWFGRYEMKTENASTGGALPSNTYSYVNPGNPAVKDYIAALDHNPYYDYGGSAAWKKELQGPIAEIMFGTDAHDIFGKDDTKSYAYTGAMSTELVTHGQQQFNGLFAQGTYRPEGVPLDVTLGLREDFWRAGGAETNSVAQHSYGTYDHFDPRLGAKYYITDQVAARGAVYENFSAPGMNQMFRSYGSTSSFSMANGSLSPETNFGQEVGLDYKWSTVSVAGTLFHNDLTNYIDRATMCSSTSACASLAPSGITNVSKIFQNLNAGNAVTEGWEVESEWKATPTVTLNSGLARTIAYATSNQTLAAKVGQASATGIEPMHGQLGLVPPLLLTSGITWQPIDHLHLTTQLRAWNKTPDDTLHSTYDSSAAVVDLGASYDISDNIAVYGSATNLFNRAYYATAPGSSTATPPTQAAPLEVFAGMRVTY